MPSGFDALREQVRNRAITAHGVAVQAIMDQVVVDAPGPDTGELERSIGEESVSITANTIISVVAARARHAIWQDQGTGVYGPTGQRITSKTPGKPLVFTIDGVTIFAMSVAGVPPTLFWSRNVTAQRWTAELEAALERS